LIPSNLPRPPLEQRLFGRSHQMAPNSQSPFAYFYFRYGLVGLLLFLGVLAIPAVRSFLMLMRQTDDPHQMVFSYHLCLVAFVVTFTADNGLLDFPTNFLLFFVLFANESLTARRRTHPTAAASHSPLTTGSAQ
jgi:O-antigen ligase